MLRKGWLSSIFLYFSISSDLQTGEKCSEPTMHEKLEIIKMHIDLAVNEKGENIAIKEMRKHLGGYLRNLPNAAKMREEINRIETQKELLETLDLFLEKE